MRLRYWLKEAFSFVRAILVLTVVYTILFSLNLDEFRFDFVPEYFSLILIGACALMAMILGTNLHTLHVPVALSFGSTRREALVGLHCHRLIPIAVTVTAALLITVFLKRISFTAVGLFGTGACLFATALGTLLGIGYAKFGKKVFFILAFVFMGFPVGLIGGIGGFYAASGKKLEIPHIDGGTWCWIVLAVGAAAYIGSALIEGRFIRKYCVKL